MFALLRPLCKNNRLKNISLNNQYIKRRPLWPDHTPLPNHPMINLLKKLTPVQILLASTIISTVMTVSLFIALGVFLGHDDLAGDLTAGFVSSLLTTLIVVGGATFFLKHLRSNESEMRWNKDLLNSIIEGAPDAIYVKDNKGKYQLVNPAAARIFDLPASEIVGRDDAAFLPPHKARMVMALDRAVMNTGRTRTYHEAIESENGELTFLSTKGPIFDAKGNISGLFVMSRDITDRKKTELALRQAKVAAEALAKSKSEFLANMSHEIRTPMNAIIGLSHLALNKEVPDDIRDYLIKINASSESLLGILNDILDFSKMEAGKLEVENAEFQLNHVLNNLQSLFSAAAEQKHLHFYIDVASDVPTGLVGDAMRIQQILANLLGNAIKFTQRGKVGLQVKLIEAGKSQAKIYFCVSDTGIGMRNETLDNLFQPFSQADTSITRRFGGTGLGLTISHGLLQLMGSEFHVESQIGKGSCFSFELTLGTTTPKTGGEVDRRHEDRKAGALGNDLREQGQPLHGMRVLVVEDNLINQQVAKEFLKLSGMSVDVANNGVEALEHIRDNVYDAVLMDVHMPEMGGIEATEHIRKQPRFANLPIIALTAGVTEEEKASCLSCGMNDFVAKPIQPKALIETLIRQTSKA